MLTQPTLPRLKTQGNTLVRVDTNEPVRLRGMNICGLEYDKSTLHSRYGFINGESSLLSQLKQEWNVNLVRIPVAQNWMIEDDTYFKTIGAIIDHANKLGIYVIISNHWEEGERNPSIMEKPTLGLSGNTTEAMWHKVANEWGDRTNLLYDIINEPHNVTEVEYAKLMQSIVDSVSKVNPQSIFIVSEPEWSHDLSYFVNNPLEIGSSSGVLYSVHQYSDFDPKSEFIENFGIPSQKIPVIVAEFDTGINISDIKYTEELVSFMESTDVVGWAGWSIGCGHPGSGDYRLQISDYPSHEPLIYMVNIMKKMNRK